MSKWAVKHELSQHKGPVHVAVFNTNGGFLLTGGQDRRIMLWNANSGNFIAGFEKHAYEVLGICPCVAHDVLTALPECTHSSHDNSRFASCGGDKDVLLWDVKEGVVQRRFSGHTGRVNAVGFNMESSLLVSGSYDSSVRLWDVRGQQRMPIQVLADAKDSITSLVIKDANIVCGSVDGHVRWYDLRAGELRADFFDQPVTSVTLSQDNQSMLVSTLDSKLRLMDGNDGTLLQTYEGHRNADYRIHSCLTYNEESVLAGDEDGKLWEWQLESVRSSSRPTSLPSATSTQGKAASQEVVSPKTLLWVARHPANSKLIATAGADGLVRLWTKE